MSNRLPNQGLSEFNRRDWLKMLGVGTAAIAAGSITGSPASALPINGAILRKPNAKRVLRVAHLTDVHIQPERAAAEGLTQCLHHVQSQSDKPDIILCTGDCVMDSFGQTRERTQLQWDLWNRVWKSENSLPMQGLLGNHDIWGWNKSKSKTTGTEAEWGKKWACDELGIEKPYRSFDRNGWHFVMLDSVRPFEESKYVAYLDDEQTAWLESDLSAAAGKPVMVLSHIPILSLTPLFADSKLPKNGEKTEIPAASMHSDWARLKALFKKHGDVKLAVSGHIHLIDRFDYGGTSYLCNGAVSGGWWKEAHVHGEGDAGYALINLYDDGSFEHEYVTYGWKYQPDAKPASQPTAAGV